MVDLIVTITIADNKATEFKNGFLKAVAKPRKYQHLTDVQFLKQYIQDILFECYQAGKIQIARETTIPTVEQDIVEVT